MILFKTYKYIMKTLKCKYINNNIIYIFLYKIVMDLLMVLLNNVRSD